VQPFLRETVAPIRDQIRPFTRQVATPVTHLREASQGLGKTVPPLRTTFTRLNQTFNALAANPQGGDEGYLFYVPWLNHNVNNLFATQDAHGPLRRGLVLESCATARLAEATALPLRPFLAMLAQTTGLPGLGEIPGCN
jgi:phospholipid/cholesterol/gamma-HCH transport system substrate-binding protein